MKELTADEVSQRIFDMRLLDSRQLDAVWSEFGTRDITYAQFKDCLLRKELLTNFQLDKIERGHRVGYFYGRYRALYIAGVGTFARVFRAVHRDRDRVMACKVLRKRYRDNAEQVELFLREARMGLRLRHPNIVRVHEVSDDIKAPYFVMEFVEGQTLRELMKMRKKLDVETSLKLITDVVNGLDHASKVGITHRDMKLSNVLVTSKGEAKLVDFGLATIAETSDSKLSASPNARSIDYVALERGTGVRKNDPRSDIYFAGCMLYNMLSGVGPLSETRDRLVRMSISRFQEIEPVNKLEPNLPIGIVSVINKAMILNPEERYQEPSDMLADLKRAKIILDKGEEETPVEEPAVEKGPPPADPEEGIGRTVLFVESNSEMQNLLREHLKKRGYRVLITSDPARAVQRVEDEARLADCVIFSTQDLGGTAVAAFNRLGESETASQVPSVLLVDKRRKRLADAAQTNEHRVLLSMPLKMKELRLTLMKLLSEKGKS
jgi:serine/threonine-protein kinase